MKHKYKIGDFVEIREGRLKGKVAKINGYTNDNLAYTVKIDGVSYDVYGSVIKRVNDAKYDVGDRVTLPAMTITSIEASPDGKAIYRLDGVTDSFTSAVLFPAWRGEALSIYRNGRETIAKRFDEHGNTAAKSVAICSDEDTYDLLTGAKVAIERMEEEAALPKDLRELLTPGTIGQTMDGKFFVAAGINVVYEGGGFDHIQSLNRDDLMWYGQHGIKFIYDDKYVPSFDIARGLGKSRIKWRRRGI